MKRRARTCGANTGYLLSSGGVVVYTVSSWLNDRLVRPVLEPGSGSVYVSVPVPAPRLEAKGSDRVERVRHIRTVAEAKQRAVAVRGR